MHIYHTTTCFVVVPSVSSSRGIFCKKKNYSLPIIIVISGLSDFNEDSRFSDDSYKTIAYFRTSRVNLQISTFNFIQTIPVYS